MIAELRDVKNREVTADEARRELERLVNDPRFRATDRQKAILRYLAESRFDGVEDGVKAYAIALDVLGRPSDFDASTDPIVRIEISRLRSALEAYYEAFGASEKASIYLPKGVYIALFPLHKEPDEPHGNLPAATEDGAGDTPLTTEPEASFGGSTHRQHYTQIAMVAVAAAILAAGTVVGGNWLPQSPQITEKPVVYISVEAADLKLKGEASQIRDALMTTLTRFTTLTVAKSGYPPPLSTRRSGRSYEVQLKYYDTDNDRNVWWQVTDSETNLVLKSGLETIDPTGRSPAAMREEIAGQLASRFASGKGVINMIESQIDPDGALGNTCVLRAEYALDSGNQPRISKARNCLEKTLAIAPDDPDATSVLSRVLLAGKDAAYEPAVRLRALELAKNAVSSSPLSDRAQTALMVAQFAAGSMDAALQAGNRAVELNPHNGEAAAKLAFVLYLGGYREAGVAMAHGTGRLTETMPADAMLVLALEAYSRGRYSEASLLSEQINGTDLLVAMLRTAASGQLSSPDAHEKSSQFSARSPELDYGFRNGIPWWREQETITTELATGLIKAGANPNKLAGRRSAQR